jgi:hypothetical protein
MQYSYGMRGGKISDLYEFTNSHPKFSPVAVILLSEVDGK